MLDAKFIAAACVRGCSSFAVRAVLMSKFRVCDALKVEKHAGFK
jgi:hypothetical protein